MVWVGFKGSIPRAESVADKAGAKAPAFLCGGWLRGMVGGKWFCLFFVTLVVAEDVFSKGFGGERLDYISLDPELGAGDDLLFV